MKNSEPFRLARRQFLKRSGVALAGLGLGRTPFASAAAAASPFVQRGYYVTFMRMPTYGLAEWERTLELIRQDGGNLLLLWMAGAFRSKKFPVTWKYNEEHQNVRRNFGRRLIQQAQRRGIRVLLGFTPFGYDGVNQYAIEHPELKALKKNGAPTDRAGIHCWGWNLCPSKPQAQRFMLEYVREMLFDFYPQADGLMIESSDYAICHCSECQGHFFDREFEFVQTISNEVWARKPEASIVVYPHYFSGAKVPGFEVLAATRPFDPRWTLFFTPHSADLDSGLIRQAQASLCWDEAPALHGPEAIQRGAHRALQAGVTGYVPSLEAFSFVPTQAEEGQTYLIGKRQVPLGFGWLPEGVMPFNELPARVNRIAYREFSHEPKLSFDEFKQRLGRDLLGRRNSAPTVEDILQLQRCFAQSRTWCQVSPIVSPARVRAMRDRHELTPAQQLQYRAALAQLSEIETRYRRSTTEVERELWRIAHWVLQQWHAPNGAMLEDSIPPKKE